MSSFELDFIIAKISPIAKYTSTGRLVAETCPLVSVLSTWRAENTLIRPKKGRENGCVDSY